MKKFIFKKEQLKTIINNEYPNFSEEQKEKIIQQLLKRESFIKKVIQDLAEEEEKINKEKTDDKATIERIVKEIIRESLQPKTLTLILDDDLNTKQLISEWEQRKQIPGTTSTYRYDSGNTNTHTQDHVHIYCKNTNKQIYAINRDGTAHDRSKYKLGQKDIVFLKNMNFTIPKDGLLEWTSLDLSKEYIVFRITDKSLLFD
jgi:hypothetical protein